MPPAAGAPGRAPRDKSGWRAQCLGYSPRYGPNPRCASRPPPGMSPVRMDWLGAFRSRSLMRRPHRTTGGSLILRRRAWGVNIASRPMYCLHLMAGNLPALSLSTLWSATNDYQTRVYAKADSTLHLRL